MTKMARGGEPRPTSRLTRWAAFAVVALATALRPQVHACGLEPTINGGFQVSHPRALEVAVAVANARGTGVLPPASADSAPNDVLLEQMLADLGRLRSRLEEGRAAVADERAAPFAVLLVGPGLWSNFRMAPGGLVAEYHTDEPLEGQVVVLMHHAVLQALLRGTLSPEQAVKHGLIAFSGSDSEPIQRAFGVGFQGQS